MRGRSRSRSRSTVLPRGRSHVETEPTARRLFNLMFSSLRPLSIQPSALTQKECNFGNGTGSSLGGWTSHTRKWHGSLQQNTRYTAPSLIARPHLTPNIYKRSASRTSATTCASAACTSVRG